MATAWLWDVTATANSSGNATADVDFYEFDATRHVDAVASGASFAAGVNAILADGSATFYVDGASYYILIQQQSDSSRPKTTWGTGGTYELYQWGPNAPSTSTVNLYACLLVESAAGRIVLGGGCRARIPVHADCAGQIVFPAGSVTVTSLKLLRPQTSGRITLAGSLTATVTGGRLTVREIIDDYLFLCGINKTCGNPGTVMLNRALADLNALLQALHLDSERFRHAFVIRQTTVFTNDASWEFTYDLSSFDANGDGLADEDVEVWDALDATIFTISQGQNIRAILLANLNAYNNITTAVARFGGTYVITQGDDGTQATPIASGDLIVKFVGVDTSIEVEITSAHSPGLVRGILLPRTFQRIVGDVEFSSTAGAYANRSLRPLRTYQEFKNVASFYDATVPVFYFVDDTRRTATAATNEAAELEGETPPKFYPEATQPESVQARLYIRPAVDVDDATVSWAMLVEPETYTVSDYKERTVLPVPHQYIEALILPLLRERCIGNPFFIAKEQAPHITEKAQKAAESWGLSTVKPGEPAPHAQEAAA